MAIAYLGLGSNLGDRQATLRAGVDALRAHGTVVAASSLYETAPVGSADQPPFLNAVIALETAATPQELLAAALALERSLGRVRTVRNAPRTLDIDLLLYDDQVRNDSGLTLPHPRFHERAFVLVPLAEIAPALRHPQLGRTAAELRDALGDTSHSVWAVAGAEWVTD